nr:hypothetical protein SHINE37_44439 [Rhizobiaceae bacterium]
MAQPADFSGVAANATPDVSIAKSGGRRGRATV